MSASSPLLVAVPAFEYGSFKVFSLEPEKASKLAPPAAPSSSSDAKPALHRLKYLPYKTASARVPITIR